jgi:hypothetical protein
MTRISLASFRLRRLKGLVAAGLILVLPAAVCAQTYPEPPDPAENARVRMGPFSVRPTLIIRDVGVDSNVFNASGTAQDRLAYVACACSFALGLIGVGLFTSVPATTLMFMLTGWFVVREVRFAPVMPADTRTLGLVSRRSAGEKLGLPASGEPA